MANDIMLEKNSLMRFFEIYKDKFFKIVIINLIYFGCICVGIMLSMGISYIMFSIFNLPQVFVLLAFVPLIALGPITGAFTKICRDYARQEPGFFFEDFKRALKSNWKQCTLLGVFQYILILAFYVGIPFYYSNTNQGTFFVIGLAVCFVALLLFIFMSYYMYMMAVTLDLKLFEILKNSLIFSFLCFGKNILLTILLLIWNGMTAIMIYGMIISQNAFAWGLGLCFLMVLYFGFMFFLVSFFTFSPIKKYILDPYYEKHTEQTSAAIPKSGENLERGSGNSEQPEFVYHNGKMIHRSALEQDSLFSDDK